MGRVFTGNTGRRTHEINPQQTNKVSGQRCENQVDEQSKSVFSFLVLTTWPVKNGIIFYFAKSHRKVPHSEINVRKIWRWYFFLLLLEAELRCSPWMFIHRCLTMKTSRYCVSVFASGIIPVKLLCFHSGSWIASCSASRYMLQYMSLCELSHPIWLNLKGAWLRCN